MDTEDVYMLTSWPPGIDVPVPSHVPGHIPRSHSQPGHSQQSYVTCRETVGPYYIGAASDWLIDGSWTGLAVRSYLKVNASAFEEYFVMNNIV